MRSNITPVFLAPVQYKISIAILFTYKSDLSSENEVSSVYKFYGSCMIRSKSS